MAGRPSAGRQTARQTDHGGSLRRTRRHNSSWGKALEKAQEQRAWKELVGHLPETARQIWDALDDARQFLRLMQTFGGQSLRVPTMPPADRNHRLRRRLGLGCLRKLSAAFGGTTLYIPRCDALRKRLLHSVIIEAFSRATHRGRSSASAVADLARRHNMTDRRVWQILKKDASVPASARLLLHLWHGASGKASS